MELNIQERLILSRLIPEKGNFETMSTVENLRKALLFTEEEVEKFEIKQTDTAISWNEQAFERIDISLSTKGEALVIEALEELDKKEELGAQEYTLFKRFKDKDSK